MKESWKVTVTGLVQGIGYRPYIAQMAEQAGLKGYVRNDAGIVTVLLSGEEEVLKSFVQNLTLCKPIGARLDEVKIEKTAYCDFTGFHIESSGHQEMNGMIPEVSVDLPTCKNCEEELLQEGNYRFRYPFISCVSCGPRYSIIKSIPYDRCNTKMDKFLLCDYCGMEYRQKGNRRRHAQTIGCVHCGPKLQFKSFAMQNSLLSKKIDGNISQNQDVMIQQAAELIIRGGVVAIKDIGGYHLVASALQESGAKAIRILKGREKKPFAVMFSSTLEAKEYCMLSKKEQELLESTARPIVLSSTKPEGKCKLAKGVNGDSPDTGAMLACNPLQILLLKECGPLIMTSANRSGEPIQTDNEKMCEWLLQESCNVSTEVGILMHDRDILTPLDDSILRVVKDRIQILRRSRGFVPEPILLHSVKNQQVFAAGSDMKACFGYAVGEKAYLSQYLGDMQDARVSALYEEQKVHMEQLFGFQPVHYVADLHPGYLTVSGLKKNTDQIMQFQHHHAHIASVMAEHDLADGTLGVAFDGTGYGLDGTVWGSEFLYCKDNICKRLGHLKTVTLIGGNEGARNTDIILNGYLRDCYGEQMAYDYLEYLHILDESKNRMIQSAIHHKINVISSSSMGRLFDAVSALLDICHYNTYEGQAAIELEYKANETTECYPMNIVLEELDGQIIGNTAPLFHQLISGRKQGICTAALARGFLNAIAEYIVETCQILLKQENTIDLPTSNGKNTDSKSLTKDNFLPISLSGGTFQNRILLEKTLETLEKSGYNVYINEKVPPSDSGLALGQLYLSDGTTKTGN